jgi:hypothetical protein
VNALRIRYLISALFLLGIAVFNFVTYTSMSSSQSTFNILSGQYEYIATTRNAGDSINGAFQEISGSLVSFYIQSSAQFASFQTGTFLNSMYTIHDVASGAISYSFSTQDTYYIVFRHGSGLLNSTETVNFQRTYITHDNFRLGLGIFFSAFVAVEIVIGFRPRKPPTVVPPPPPISTYIQGQSPVAPEGQTATKRCSLCGQTVGEQLNFCPTCGNKLGAMPPP